MITLTEARELLKRAVETQGPDFVYNPGGREDCYYVPFTPPDYDGEHDWSSDPRTKTGCLVGVALELAGETFQRDSQKQIRTLHKLHQGKLTDEAAEYFQIAQSEQDIGRSWGEAFWRAEMYAELVERRVTPTIVTAL